MNQKQYFMENDFSNTKSILEYSKIFSNVNEAIEEIVENGNILILNADAPIIKQHTSEKDIYFILEGCFDISINGENIATHGVSDILGEMAIVDDCTKRTATVTALENSTVLKIEEDKFVAIANSHPRIWRNIAAEISNRLRKIGGIRF